jgi:hypothetical protein
VADDVFEQEGQTFYDFGEEAGVFDNDKFSKNIELVVAEIVQMDDVNDLDAIVDTIMRSAPRENVTVYCTYLLNLAARIGQALVGTLQGFSPEQLETVRKALLRYFVERKGWAE